MLCHDSFGSERSAERVTLAKPRTVEYQITPRIALRFGGNERRGDETKSALLTAARRSLSVSRAR